MTNIGIEEGSGNVYRDLGFENPHEMFLMAKLTMAIEKLIGARALTRARAAEIIGLPELKLSRMLIGDFQDITALEMFGFVIALGQGIEIKIGPERIVLGGTAVPGQAEAASA
jgi:predicted XRE-type DNA-binding protein